MEGKESIRGGRVGTDASAVRPSSDPTPLSLRKGFCSEDSDLGGKEILKRDWVFLIPTKT